MKHRKRKKNRRTSQRRLGELNLQYLGEKSIPILEKKLAQDPNSAELHNHLATAYLLQEAYEKAVFHLEKVRDLDPEYPSLDVRLSTAYAVLQKFPEAKALASAALERGACAEPEKLHYILGRACVQLSEYEAALSHFQTALDLGIEDAARKAAADVDINFELGHTYLLLNKFELAHEHFQKALDQNSDKSALHASVALLYMKQGDIDAAEPYLIEALMLDPECDAAQRVLEVFNEEREKQSTADETEEL